LSGIFGYGPTEINSGNIVNYGCVTDATSCNLSDQSIASIAPDTFVHHSVLTELNLSNNQLSSLPSDMFDTLPLLNYLNLSNNQLSSLPSDITKLTNLSDQGGLDVYYNNIIYYVLNKTLLDFVDAKHEV